LYFYCYISYSARSLKISVPALEWVRMVRITKTHSADAIMTSRALPNPENKGVSYITIRHRGLPSRGLELGRLLSIPEVGQATIPPRIFAHATVVIKLQDRLSSTSVCSHREGMGTEEKLIPTSSSSSGGEIPTAASLAGGVT